MKITKQVISALIECRPGIVVVGLFCCLTTPAQAQPSAPPKAIRSITPYSSPVRSDPGDRADRAAKMAGPPPTLTNLPPKEMRQRSASAPPAISEPKAPTPASGGHYGALSLIPKPVAADQGSNLALPPASPTYLGLPVVNSKGNTVFYDSVSKVPDFQKPSQYQRPPSRNQYDVLPNEMKKASPGLPSQYQVLPPRPSTLQSNSSSSSSSISTSPAVVQPPPLPRPLPPTPVKNASSTGRPLPPIPAKKEEPLPK